MENQHRLINTYRDLSHHEIDLMNECKVMEAQLLAFQKRIVSYLKEQEHNCEKVDPVELARMIKASPFKWAAVSLTHFEQGFMALVRSIAQPNPPEFESVGDSTTGD